jgi:hypothetical protein
VEGKPASTAATVASIPICSARSLGPRGMDQVRACAAGNSPRGHTSPSEGDLRGARVRRVRRPLVHLTIHPLRRLAREYLECLQRQLVALEIWGNVILELQILPYLTRGFTVRNSREMAVVSMGGRPGSSVPSYPAGSYERSLSRSLQDERQGVSKRCPRCVDISQELLLRRLNDDVPCGADMQKRRHGHARPWIVRIVVQRPGT